MPPNEDPLFLDNCVEGCARSHQRLLAVIDAQVEIDNAEAWLAAPSHLPGWTRAHVIAHLARNAESHVHLFAEAERGVEGNQYPGGAEQRTEGISTYAVLPPAELVAKHRAAIYALEAAWAHTSASAWQGSGRNTVGARMRVIDMPLFRWREVEVHTADLDAGISFADWNQTYVRYDLPRMTMLQTSRKPMGMTALPEAALRLSETERLAWLLGRHTSNGLEPQTL